jgi:hypothetical protein
VTFTLGESGDELKAHKFFLITASPVFHSLFVNNADAALELKIAAISKATMTEICRFAYSEVVKLTKDNMLDVLFAASKFQMKFLMEKTIDFICKDGMNENTVFKILEVNQKDSNMRINLKCFEYIQKNHDKCFKSTDFLSLSPDLLRAVMQTCKVPRTAAKAAIALWSAFPDNADEDLDELIALVSLNEEVEEINNNVSDLGLGSDCESNFSSRQGSSAGGVKRERQRQPKGKQPDNRRGPKPANMHQQQQFVQRQQHIQHQQNLLGQSPIKNFFMRGNVVRRNCNYANLNLTSLLPISITEIHFVYDLSSTDKEFDLHIFDLTAKKSDLFYHRISTSDKIDGTFSRYRLIRPCHIGANRKIWVRIEFLRPEFRLSFDKFNVASESPQDHLTLRREGSSSSSAQIISSIVYSNAEN